MKLYFVIFLAGLATVSIASPTTLEARVSHSVGVARDNSSGEISYIEQHQYLLDGAHLVTYFDPVGNVMTKRSITYPSLPQHPEIEEIDFKRKVKLNMYAVNDILHTRRSLGDEVEYFELPLDSTTIVDAGFDAFVRSNWENFQVGKPQTYKFAIAGQERLLRVSVARQPDDGDLALFVINPKNFFIGLLLPEIQLWYDRNRRLSRYNGLTNLDLPDGSSRNVAIEFTHYDRPF